MKRTLVCIIGLLSSISGTFANDGQASNFDLASTYIENDCDFDKMVSNGFEFHPWFFEYDRIVTKHALVACKAIYDDRLIPAPSINDYWPKDTRVSILSANLEQIAEAFNLDASDTKFQTLQSHLNSWRSQNDLPLNENANIPFPPEFTYIAPQLENEYFLSTPQRLRRDDRFTLSSEQNAFCKSTFEGASDCDEVFNAFNKVNDKLSVFQRLDVAKKNRAYVAIQEAKWDTFSDQSRFQTYIDVAFTSWVYRKHFSRSDDLITPPPLQLFALRPSIVYEHLSSAPRGQRDELALAIEWIGFNAWDLSIPFGVSITSIYADREYSKTLGHGLTFHVNNSFSFGVSNRGGGNNSVYINFELMEWFSANRDMLKAYR